MMQKLKLCKIYVPTIKEKMIVHAVSTKVVFDDVGKSIVKGMRIVYNTNHTYIKTVVSEELLFIIF